MTVAEDMISRQILTHYEKPRIAALCQKAGLFPIALQQFMTQTEGKIGKMLATEDKQKTQITDYLGLFNALVQDKEELHLLQQQIQERLDNLLVSLKKIEEWQFQLTAEEEKVNDHERQLKLVSAIYQIRKY